MLFVRLNQAVVKKTPLRLFSSFCSESALKHRGPSYYHNVGKKPLAYRTIGQQLELCSHTHPEEYGIVSVHENEHLNFASILKQCDRLAASFHKIGLNRGDCIGIWAPNLTFFYISMLAAARAGLVSVGINPAYCASELHYCINKVNLKAIVAPDSFKTTHYYEILKTICPEINDSDPGKLSSKNTPSLKSVIIKSQSRLPGVFLYDDIFNFADAQAVERIRNLQNSIQPDEPCNIQFTSGTTGHPKAAIIKHFGLLNNAIHIAKRNELDTKHQIICVQLPLFHAGGIVVSIAASLVYGSTLVLPAPAFNPKASVEAIVKEQCSVIYGTPTMYVDLIKEIVDSKARLTTPEIAVFGGASCSPKLIQNIKNILNVRKVKTVFGQSEATAAVCQSLPGESEDNALHTVGHVTDHVEVKVTDKDGSTVPFGEPGELCIRGYLTSLGYYNDVEQTKELFGNDGWMKSGDQVILREDGYVKIVGRLKEMVIRGGENIFPKEIEDFLNNHPQIMESQVIGVPDERMGEELCAYIRLRDRTENFTYTDLKEFGVGKIAHFKIPRYIRVVTEFPKTASGKIQKFKLLEQYNEEKSL